MTNQSLLFGAALLIFGFVLGRLTAPKQRTTVVYPAPARRDGSATPGGPDADVEAALRAGNKIEAIKRYRDAYGTDLKGSKDAVEALEARLGLGR